MNGLVVTYTAAIDMTRGRKGVGGGGVRSRRWWRGAADDRRQTRGVAVEARMATNSGKVPRGDAGGHREPLRKRRWPQGAADGRGWTRAAAGSRPRGDANVHEEPQVAIGSRGRWSPAGRRECPRGAAGSHRGWPREAAWSHEKLLRLASNHIGF
jgi:hypothetical protein